MEVPSSADELTLLEVFKKEYQNDSCEILLAATSTTTKNDDLNENSRKCEIDNPNRNSIQDPTYDFISSSHMEIPPPENIIEYSIVPSKSYYAPANGPNISELRLHSEGLYIPDLQINHASYFLPVLKTLHVNLEPKPIMARKSNLRKCKYGETIGKNISKIFDALEAPQLENLQFLNNLKKQSRKFWQWRKGDERWETALVNFIKKHFISLKILSVAARKSSIRPETDVDIINPFPELEELSIHFWDYHTGDYLSPMNNFWVALLKSQSKQLRKLEWRVSCCMSWTQTIIPVITKNANTLESIEMLLPIVAIDSEKGRRSFQDKTFIFSIDCWVFHDMKQLKTLYLGWQYCFIHNLQYLPRGLQELGLFSIPVRSSELFHLKRLPELKLLNLIIPNYCVIGCNAIVEITRKEEYGVTLSVLKYLLTNRSLMEITVNLFPDANQIISDDDLVNTLTIYGENPEKSSWWTKITNWFQDPNLKLVPEEFQTDLREFFDASSSINVTRNISQMDCQDFMCSDVSHVAANNLQNLIRKNVCHIQTFVLR